MTKTYKMQDLDCANCARKMEDAIRKLEGVTEVHVNFLTQKMILTGICDTAVQISRRSNALMKTGGLCF